MDKEGSKSATPSLLGVWKIWDEAPHNAFTDLCYFNDYWYCVFRESDEHEQGKHGTIRLIRSSDGQKWDSVAHFVDPDFDLRDPKLSITPDMRLMLLIGVIELDVEKKYRSRHCRVSFSIDGLVWQAFAPILLAHEWIWRVTWSRGKAYGVSYRFSNLQNLRDEWIVSLWESKDGIHYEQITVWDIKGRPNETTLQVLPSGEMIALVRRNERGKRHAMIGSSWPPYDQWNFHEAHIHLGGPNFVVDEHERMWACGRMMFFTPYGWTFKTVFASMTRKDLRPILTLPSEGDCSYPGMVLKDGVLWISYYSTHEDRTAIYLAKVRI